MRTGKIKDISYILTGYSEVGIYHGQELRTKEQQLQVYLAPQDIRPSQRGEGYLYGKQRSKKKRNVGGGRNEKCLLGVPKQKYCYG